MQNRFCSALMQRAREALHHCFSPLTWSLAWLMGSPETVPTYCDWLNGCRYVTPAGRNIFKDLGFPPNKAEELQCRTYLKILEEMNIGSTDCTEVKTLALETFGDPRLAVEWLQEENTVLRMSPVAYLSKGHDKREVFKILTSIGHGGAV